MNKAENRKEWSRKVKEYKESGKTKEEWCKKKNITIKQFNYWLRQFSEETTETHWVPVEINQDEITINVAIMVKIGSATVEVQPGFDKDHLSEVLKVLKTIC